MPDKKLVVWSGGLDSTLLLHNLAKNSSEKWPIQTFSFIPDFIDQLKLEKEQEVRKNYLRYAESLGYHIKPHTIKISSSTYPTDGWSQQKSWFSFILPYIPDNCEVNFGYVMGDCVWLAVSNFYKIFQEFKYLGSFENSNLKFPFAFEEKWEVWQKFLEAEIPLDCFWTCEKPRRIRKKIVPCGKCEPCMHLKSAKYNLSIRKENK